MPVVQSYPVHVFCHADLNTTDAQAARSFYGTLLDWDFTETQLEGQSVHSMGRIDGYAVAGLAQLPPNAEAAGMRPNWTPYIHVADADRTLAVGEEAGGTTVMPPFAVEDAAGLVREPGAMVWFDLLTEDRSATAAYYRTIFGWETEQDRIGKGHALLVGGPDSADEWRYGAVLDDGPPAWLSPVPLWLVYFQVADIDASVQLALELSAQAPDGIKLGPVGRIARLLDPQGVPFGLVQAD